MAPGERTVQIDTSKTAPNGYGSRSVGRVSKVTADDPWDPLSKIFKRYVHTIQFPLRGGQPNQYNVKVVAKGSGNNTFTLNSIDQWVENVEVYFRAYAGRGSTDPLIVGFVYATSDRTGCNSNKCYYTWNHLTRRSNNVKTGTVGTEAVIKEQDLVTRLLEEIGTFIIGGIFGRQNKLVIRLDERPGDGGNRSQYPGSGQYSGKITVNKAEFSGPLSGLTGYEKYEHTFSSVRNVSDLYVSYHNNSRFFKTGSGHKIEKVTAYYEDGTDPVSSNGKKLVLITFTLTNGSTYLYKYYDFVNDLKKVRSWASDVKTILCFSGCEGLPMVGHGGSSLKTRLYEETERLRHLIAFVQDNSGLKNNENITPKESKVGSGYTFKKVTMKPNTSDVPGVRGSSVGPWYLYSGNLFTGERGDKIDKTATIQDTVLTDIFTTGNIGNGDTKKYNSIAVYYTSNKALLVEFDQAATGNSIRGRGSGDGTKIYFKRKDQKGDNWEKADTDISSNGGKVDESVLTSIGKAAGIIEDSNLGATIGGSIAGVGGVGGIAGIGIYKYPQLFLSLIGR